MEGASDTLYCSGCSSPGHASSGSRLKIGKCPPGGLVDNIQGELQCKPKPNAPDIPAGGYQHSCLGCELLNQGSSKQDTIVSCSHCGTANGQRRPSSYVISRCPIPGSLDNDDGGIVCKGVPNAFGIPAGEYRSSCQGCVLDGFILQCSLCMRSTREQVSASFDMAKCPQPAKLENVDGTLHCAGLPHTQDVPHGGYKDSCHGCQLIDGHRLMCIGCKSADGRWLEASFDITKCRVGGIGNHNGQLACNPN